MLPLPLHRRRRRRSTTSEKSTAATIDRVATADAAATATTALMQKTSEAVTERVVASSTQPVQLAQALTTAPADPFDTGGAMDATLTDAATAATLAPADAAGVSASSINFFPQTSSNDGGPLPTASEPPQADITSATSHHHKKKKNKTTVTASTDDPTATDVGGIDTPIGDGDPTTRAAVSQHTEAPPASESVDVTVFVTRVNSVFKTITQEIKVSSNVSGTVITSSASSSVATISKMTTISSSAALSQAVITIQTPKPSPTGNNDTSSDSQLGASQGPNIGSTFLYVFLAVIGLGGVLSIIWCIRTILNSRQRRNFGPETKHERRQERVAKARVEMIKKAVAEGSIRGNDDADGARSSSTTTGDASSVREAVLEDGVWLPLVNVGEKTTSRRNSAIVGFNLNPATTAPLFINSEGRETSPYATMIDRHRRTSSYDLTYLQIPPIHSFGPPLHDSLHHHPFFAGPAPMSTHPDWSLSNPRMSISTAAANGRVSTNHGVRSVGTAATLNHPRRRNLRHSASFSVYEQMYPASVSFRRSDEHHPDRWSKTSVRPITEEPSEPTGHHCELKRALSADDIASLVDRMPPIIDSVENAGNVDGGAPGSDPRREVPAAREYDGTTWYHHHHHYDYGYDGAASGSAGVVYPYAAWMPWVVDQTAHTVGDATHPERDSPPRN